LVLFDAGSHRIVGVDERDIDRDWISWVSPLAKALVGDRVLFNAPCDEQNFEIIAVCFDDRTSEK